MYLRLLLLIAITLIAGCSSIPSQEDDFLDRLGTIAIISLIGNEISLQHVDNSYNPRSHSNVADWRLDDFAVRAATDYLTSRGHKVAHLRYKAATLLKTYTNSQSNTDPRINNIKPELKMLLSKYPSNTFILIYRNKTSDFVGDSNENLYSQGLYNTANTSRSDSTATYSSIRIDLVRTKDFSVPASATSNAHTLINAAYWNKSYKSDSNTTIPLKSSRRKNIKNYIKKDLKSTIDDALMKIGL